MSFENKGSMPPTIVISLDPDRSGNYVCSGVADDVDMQAAIDRLPSGGLIFIKRGTYAISARITITDNIFIQGEGIDITTLRLDNDVDDIFLVNSRAALGDPKNTNIHISDLTLDGNGANQVSGSHIVANNTTILFYEYVENFSFRRVKFYDGQDYNLRLGFAGNVLDGIVENCIIDLNRDSGGGLADGSGQRISYIGCEASNSALSGFWHWGKNITYTGCRSHDNASAGFGCEGATEGATEYIRYNDCLSYGNAHGMQLFGCRYIQVIGGSYSLNEGHGIWIHSRVDPLASHDVTIKGVDVINNNVSDAAFYGIGISGRAGDYNRNLKIQGCTIADDRVTALQDRGIEAEYLTDSIFEGNIIYEHTAEGIRLNTECDRVKIRNNIIYDNDGDQINVNNVNCDDNEVIGNFLSGTTLFSDSGNNTKLALKPFQFTDVTGGSAVIQVASPVGCYVSDAGGTAIAWGQLPQEVQQVVRLKVWAVAKDAPVNAGGQMHCEFTFNAGASNAAYNEAGKSWNVANKDSEEADYVSDDIVHWILTDADTGDSEMTALVAGDSFEILAIYESAADPDGDTDAKFRVVEVEYV